jgi:hypothetical protein
MPTWQTLAAFGQELRGLEVDLTGPEARRITRAMGKEAQDIANRQAAASLGQDRAFSGWNRGQPIPADTRLVNVGASNTMLIPTRHGAGIWTTVTFGRNQGNASGFAGPGINIRTGLTARTKSGAVRRSRARRSRRWNGVTRGKGTGERAVSEMDRRLPLIADKAVLKVSRKRFDVT